ncbi:unnamed protein product [Gongylonema pulchrum]|uniref:SERTA domain-containing protein n=1 Tax=Gongylonema pulchrum TaxID=637853 RepID=A0A183D8W1_9BILA|nr:unnamed protein product [Gongylonema pulchrum]
MEEIVSGVGKMLLDSAAVETGFSSGGGGGVVSSGSSSSSSSSASDCEETGAGTSPRKLLSLAIYRRRALFNSKERDLRLELLHTSLIQSLCKFLGERRAKRRHHRRAAKRHFAHVSGSRECADKREYCSSSSSFAQCNSAVLCSGELPELADFCGFLDVGGEAGASSPAAGEMAEFGYSPNLYSYTQQDNCVQLRVPNAAEDDGAASSPPVCKKPRYEKGQLDADPFGLDSLFSELCASPSLASPG